jgi:hypothetical protein
MVYQIIEEIQRSHILALLLKKNPANNYKEMIGAGTTLHGRAVAS